MNPDNPTAEATILLDPNTLSEDGTTSISTKVWSEDGQYMAYQLSVGGSDWQTIKVRDAEKCIDLEKDELKWVKFSGMSWTHDNLGFFYSRFDAPETLDKESMDKAGTETD